MRLPSFITGRKWKRLSEPLSAAEAELFSGLETAFGLTGQQVSGGHLCQTVQVQVGGRNYYVKRYRTRGKHWRKAFRRSRPLREARNLAYFDSKGIPVPRVVACGSRRILGIFCYGALVTEEIPHTADLQSLAGTRPELFHDRAWLLPILDTLADHVRSIHEDGFIHRDLKWRNILIAPDAAPPVYFIDCPSGSRWPWFWKQRYMAKDLGHLEKLAAQHISRTMRLRFFLRYRNHSRLTQEDKRFIRKILSLRHRKDLRTG